MIKIITGKMNSAKTSRMQAYYDEYPQGDGFVSLKIMRGDKVYGYSALKLSSKEEFPLVVRDEFLQEPFPICCQIGPYLFNQNTVSFIYREFDAMIKKRIEPLFLDEVGLLEIEGKGFDLLVKRLVDSGLDVVFSIREDLVTPFLNKYHIQAFTII